MKIDPNISGQTAFRYPVLGRAVLPAAAGALRTPAGTVVVYISGPLRRHRLGSMRLGT
jgi:hypothetical protein